MQSQLTRRHGPKHARFWIWWNDFVRLSLAEGESVTLFRSEKHDEGYSSETRTYAREGDFVSCEIYTADLDCAGPLRTTTYLVCPVRELEAGGRGCRQLSELEMHQLGRQSWDCHLDHGPAQPKWTEEAAWRRDLFAEMAGY